MRCDVAWKLVSPNGSTRVEAGLDGKGRLLYSVYYGATCVVEDSGLGLDVRPGGLLGNRVQVLYHHETTIDETYSIHAGKCSEVRNHCVEMILKLRETANWHRCIDIIFRAYDDGVAIRYTLPPQDVFEDFEIIAERTKIRIPADCRCWAIHHAHFRTSFEGEFEPQKLSDLRPGGLIGLPLTFQMENGPAVAITEANLTNFAGMYLEGLDGEGTYLVSRLARHPDGQYGVVKGVTPHSTPWRVIMMADSPVKLIESNILYNLNDPSAIHDVSWIKPGKVAWDWWSGPAAPGRESEFTVGMNNATMKHFIDFAQEMKLEYFLLDGGWYGSEMVGADITKSVPEIDLPMLVEYARERDVDMMVWMHMKSTVGQFEKAFAYYERIGVKGVKIDFFDRDDQQIVNYIRTLIETAAKHKLIVDLHGIYKPTGIQRTYPNLLTHEGVMGAEYNKWSRRVTPEHNVTIPFTRMLAGPMDYTPGCFHNTGTKRFVPQNHAPSVMGTRCHNLAMYVVYQSALQMVSDYPDAIRNQPGAEFIKVVPAAWDETVGLDGEIGEYVVIARRKGADWFIGAMTNSHNRQIEASLEFLDSDASFEATIYEDGPDAENKPTELAVVNRMVSKTDTLSLKLAPAGGYAAHLRRIA